MRAKNCKRGGPEVPKGGVMGAKKVHGPHQLSFGSSNFGAPGRPKGSKILRPEERRLRRLEAKRLSCRGSNTPWGRQINTAAAGHLPVGPGW